jgi:hypothetical protein
MHRALVPRVWSARYAVDPHRSLMSYRHADGVDETAWHMEGRSHNEEVLPAFFLGEENKALCLGPRMRDNPFWRSFDVTNVFISHALLAKPFAPRRSSRVSDRTIRLGPVLRNATQIIAHLPDGFRKRSRPALSTECFVVWRIAVEIGGIGEFRNIIRQCDHRNFEGLFCRTPLPWPWHRSVLSLVMRICRFQKQPILNYHKLYIWSISSMC